MSFDYVRKLVSGNKARFIDPQAAVNLDLVYVTDRIIIMGYPASGVAGLYRNRRRDVLRFINARHGDKWWIWNLCPLYENAYSPESMHGRVSRYPFPDHHPPPLPLLPLAVREMTAWLEGDAERVAIIHCKAGKGRSGTLLCSYLLSLPTLPPPPELDRSYSYKELAERRSQRDEAAASAASAVSAVSGDSSERDGWVYIGGGRGAAGVQVPAEAAEGAEGAEGAEREGGVSTPARSERITVDSVARSTSSSTTTLSRPSPAPSVDIPVRSGPPFGPLDIGDEGEPGAKGQEDRADGRVDEVFKLHSGRRMKPTSTGRGVSIPSQRRWCRYIHLLFTRQAPASYLAAKPQRVRLESITILLYPPSGWQKPLASLIVGSGGTGKGKGWASAARYDDGYVEELKARGGAGEGVDGQVSWGGVGGEGSFDSHKMFRSFGKMVPAEVDDEMAAVLPEDHEDFIVHHLTPSHGALTVDRSRELRLKFHLGAMPLGWAWLIPAFHLPEPAPSASSAAGAGGASPAARAGPASAARIHTLYFPRSQVDFPLGPGAALHEVRVRLAEVAEGDEEAPTRLMSDAEEREEGVEDTQGEKVREEGE